MTTTLRPSDSQHTQVIIAGGGPAGLTLANELGLRGIRAILFDQKPGTTPDPQANATQSRTMEHFRRLGFASEIRAQGLPADFPTDVVYFTRFCGHELARFRMPARARADTLARAGQAAGAWSTPEMPHRCSQLFIEPVIRRHAERYPSISLRFGMRVLGFTEHANGVSVQVEPVDDGPVQSFECDYFVGCDGARSATRHALGIEMLGHGKIERDFLGGRMYAAYFASKDLYATMGVDRAWMYWTINRERRSILASLDGKETFVFHTQLKGEDLDREIDAARGQAFLQEAMGKPCDFRLIHSGIWNAGYMLVATHYSAGRVFLAGDAVHLFTPTGGLGYNTAIDDVANLGWKLAAVLNGWGGSELLSSYSAERQPIGARNTGKSRLFADSIGGYVPSPDLEGEGPEAEQARAEAGAYLLDHARREFNIPGITFGARYDASPIIIGDGSTPPPDVINDYVPNAVPGGRTPHLWLASGDSLYDQFGTGFTLLRITAQTDPVRWIEAAQAMGCPLTVVNLCDDGSAAEAAALYEAPLALIRPDQHVAWRGGDQADPAAVLAHACGHPVDRPHIR